MSLAIGTLFADYHILCYSVCIKLHNEPIMSW